MAVHALTRLAGNTATPSTQPAAPRQESVPAQAPSVPAQNAGLAAFESLQKSIDEAQSLKEEFNALLNHMHAARGEVESLLARTTQASEEVKSQLRAPAGAARNRSSTASKHCGRKFRRTL